MREALLVDHKYEVFCPLLLVYSMGLIWSKPLARKFAQRMRWPLRHCKSYKTKTKWTAPLIGLPLIVGLFFRRSLGWHWWLSGCALVCLSIIFHGELVDEVRLATVQRFDQTLAAYHFAYHLWLALCVGSGLGIILLGLVVAFYFFAWIEAYTHVGVHVCATLAGLVILAAQANVDFDVSHVPFVLQT